MWRNELPGLQSRNLSLIEAPQELAALAEHTDARAEIGGEPVDVEIGHQFADDAVWTMTAGDRQGTRPVHIDDLRFVLSVPVEDLHPVVLAVGDVDPAVRVTADIVREIEFTGPGSGLAPTHQQLAVGRKLVDCGIAVTVRDINVAVGSERAVRAAAKWLVAHEWRWLFRLANLQKQFSVEREFPDGVIAVVGEIDGVVRTDIGPVGVFEDPMSP